MSATTPHCGRGASAGRGSLRRVGHLLSANAGSAREIEWRGRRERSGIDKRPVPGDVAVGRLGLTGDVQVDTAHHGGPEQAVYAYAAEDLALWAERLERELLPGSFGENLTLSGVDVTEARIGERWRIGSVLLEIGDVRIPCLTFQTWLQEPTWVRRFTQEARPGAYLRVLEGGQLRAGDPVEVVETRDHDVTVGLMFRAVTTERALLPRLLVEPRVRHEALATAREYAASVPS
ncbi:MAG: MOSC domain-containing protein [Nocardioidaceae bacterium]|nr:MOSC domain-containing protein [Nocardioidaceae bacterium]